MSENDLSGVCPILATPYNEDESIDYEGLASQTEFLAEGGAHAAVLFGWASEFYRLTDEERDQMVQVAVEAAEGYEMDLIASVTHEATVVATEWAQRYEEMGVDCLMTLPPEMRSPSPDEVQAYIRQIGEAVDIPVMVQQRPSSVPLGADRFIDLYEATGNVKYFKIETNPPGPLISELTDRSNGEVGVFVGQAGQDMIEAYRRGACGVMPGSSMFDIYLQIHDRLENGDIEGAIDLHSVLYEALNTILTDIIGLEKEISRRRGMFETNVCRSPNPDGLDEPEEDLFERHYTRLEKHFTAKPPS